MVDQGKEEKSIKCFETLLSKSTTLVRRVHVYGNEDNASVGFVLFALNFRSNTLTTGTRVDSDLSGHLFDRVVYIELN